jgi:hypothetical protein
MNTEVPPIAFWERRIEVLENKFRKAKHLNVEMGAALRKYHDGFQQDRLFPMYVEGLIARSESK